MDTLESACTALSTIAKAAEVCVRKRNATTRWDLERGFCSSLEATLEDIIAFSPIDESFTHEQELTLLVQAILQPCLTFYETITPCMSDLQRGCEPDAAEEVLSEMEIRLENLIIGRVKALRKQVHRYLQTVDTLLLLYIIDVLASPPLEVISEDELAALQSLRQRAKVVGLQDLEQLAELFSARTLTVETQQMCLISTRRDVEHHWEITQMTIHGIWSDAMSNSNDGVSAPKDNPIVFSGTGTHYTQNTDFKSSRRKPVRGNFEASQTGQTRDTNEYTKLHQPTSRPTAETSIYQDSSPIRYLEYNTINSAQKGPMPKSHDVSTELPSPGTVNPEIRRKQVGLSNAQEKVSGKQHERMSNPPQQAHSHGTRLSAHRQRQEYPPNLPGVSNRSYQRSHSSSDSYRENRSKRHNEGHAAPNSDAYLTTLDATELEDMSNRSRVRSSQPRLQPGWNTSGDFSQSQQQAQSPLLRPGEGMSGYSNQQQPSTDASRSSQQYAHTSHMQYHPDHESRNYVQQSPIGASNESHDRAGSRVGYVAAGAGGAAILGVTAANVNANHLDEDDTDKCCSGSCGCCSDACECCSGACGCCSNGSGNDGDGCWPKCCSDSDTRRGDDDDDSCCIIM